MTDFWLTTHDETRTQLSPTGLLSIMQIYSVFMHQPDILFQKIVINDITKMGINK